MMSFYPLHETQVNFSRKQRPRVVVRWQNKTPLQTVDQLVGLLELAIGKSVVVSE